MKWKLLAFRQFIQAQTERCRFMTTACAICFYYTKIIDGKGREDKRLERWKKDSYSSSHTWEPITELRW
jgi:hypothetical protein